ncbi:MAG: proline iminopeptidase-family hydrolase [Gammaproteobacteria bacterium]|nr:proline iminopeptidase-family hydrolase [Gammaproteobacteria bacterium]MDH3373621.1 proline iminopeptidase-family hydrolase [Gammaproteobacteria bacterium]
MKAKILALILVAAAVVACSTRPSLPDDGFVNVPGGRVAFRVVGSGPSTPVLIIHGGPGSSSCDFVANVDGIAADRPVILYDQLGSGYSDRIRDLERFARLPLFVEEIDAIRAELNLGEVHLVGHSWGTTVALEYLLTTEPTGIKSTVFVSPFFGTERWISDANDLLAELPAAAQEIVRLAVESGDFDSSDFEEANDLFWSKFRVRTPGEQLNLEPCEKEPSGDSGLYEYMWGPSEFISTGTLKDHDRIGRLQELDLPVLFVTGQHDEARPETVKFFQELVEGSELKILPDAAHVVYLDQTDMFNSVLAGFFEKVESPR